MTEDLRELRKTLGLSRAEVAASASVDKRSLQLLEMDLSHDDEARQKVLAVLRALLKASNKVTEE